jgi:hypothetical protein
MHRCIMLLFTIMYRWPTWSWCRCRRGSRSRSRNVNFGFPIPMPVRPLLCPDVAPHPRVEARLRSHDIVGEEVRSNAVCDPRPSLTVLISTMLYPARIPCSLVLVTRHQVPVRVVVIRPDLPLVVQVYLRIERMLPGEQEIPQVISPALQPLLRSKSKQMFSKSREMDH